ncbi:MAG: hypothetical protein JWO38_7936 [Gemmataceae bacterium]|nr:hypothetical protein [Gemmataceae bacterium]
MDRFWIQGVVKNGQIVLETPIDLPDGTVVTVIDHDPGDEAVREPTLKISDTEFEELTAFLTGRKDQKDWPEFKARIKRSKGMS